MSSALSLRHSSGQAVVNPLRRSNSKISVDYQRRCPNVPFGVQHAADFFQVCSPWVMIPEGYVAARLTAEGAQSAEGSGRGMLGGAIGLRSGLTTESPRISRIGKQDEKALYPCYPRDPWFNTAPRIFAKNEDFFL